MGDPIAVAVFESEWDDSLDVVHEQMDILPPPKFQSPSQVKKYEQKKMLCRLHALSNCTPAEMNGTAEEAANESSDSIQVHAGDGRLVSANMPGAKKKNHQVV